MKRKLRPKPEEGTMNDSARPTLATSGRIGISECPPGDVRPCWGGGPGDQPGCDWRERHGLVT